MTLQTVKSIMLAYDFDSTSKSGGFMVKRLLSLAIGIFLLNIYIRSQLAPNDPLFLFASTNASLNIGLILLSYLLVVVTFKDQFKSWIAYAACMASAVILLIAGGLSLFPGLVASYWISNILLPFDGMVVLEAGVILGLCGLTYQHEPQPAWVKNFSSSVLLRKLAPLAPRIPHPPIAAAARLFQHP